MKNRAAKTAVVCVVVVLLFLALTMLFTRPLLKGPGDRVLAHYADNLLNIYILAWTTHSLATKPLRLFDATIFYPEKDTLAYSDYQFANGLMSWPFSAATGNPVLAHNAVVMLSFVLGGLGAFFLVLHLTGSALAGVGGGIIFAFASFKLANIGQVQSLSTEFIPFAFLFLHLFTEKRKPAYALLFGLCAALTFWSAWLYGFFLAFAVLVFLVVLAVMKRHEISAALRRRAPPEKRRALIRYVLLFAAGVVVVAVLVLPFAIPYLKVQARHSDFQRDIKTVKELSPDVKEFLGANLYSKAWGRATASFTTPVANGMLFPNLIPLILGVAGIVFLARYGRFKERFALAFYTVLAVVSAVMCLGVTLNFFGNKTGLPMPYQLLYYLFPGFKAIRTPARMFVLVLLSLAVLGGFGIKMLHDKVAGRVNGATAIVLTVFVLALLALELMPASLPTTKVQTGSQVPAVYRWLGSREGDAANVTLPLAQYKPHYKRGINNELSWLLLEPWRTYYNVYDFKPTVNGYSGYVPPSYYAAVKATRDFPSDEALLFLEKEKVKYLVVSSKSYSGDQFATLMQMVSAGKLKVAKALGTDYVFELPVSSSGASQQTAK